MKTGFTESRLHINGEGLSIDDLTTILEKEKTVFSGPVPSQRSLRRILLVGDMGSHDPYCWVYELVLGISVPEGLVSGIWSIGMGGCEQFPARMEWQVLRS